MEQNQCNNTGEVLENVENPCPETENIQEAGNTIVCAECGNSYDADLQECPNCGCPTSANLAPAEPSAAPSVTDESVECEEGCALGAAVKEFFARILYVLFALPFKTWQAGVRRLAAQGRSCNCYEGVKTEWPLITYGRRLFLDYLFDALILVSWLSIFAAVWDLLHYGAACICTWVLAVYLCYLMPVFVTLAKDVVTLLLRYPIRRLIHLHRKHAKCIDAKLDRALNK